MIVGPQDLSRLEAFFEQLRPVIGRALPVEEAEALRLSMLEHLPRQPLRLGEVRLRLDRAWSTGDLPPGSKRQRFPAGRRPVRPTEGIASESGREAPPVPQAFPFFKQQEATPRKGPGKAPKVKAKVAGAVGPEVLRPSTFAWD